MDPDRQLIDAINRVLRENPGVTSVSFGGETTTFSSLREMLAVRDDLQRRVDVKSGRSPLFLDIQMGGV